MTPLGVQMLIWFCTRAKEAGVFRGLELCQPQREIRNWMLAEGVIEPWDKESSALLYRATDKGQAWLEMICNTPLPVRNWNDPRVTKGAGHGE